MQLYIFLLVIILSVAAYFVATRQMKDKLNLRFIDRNPLTPNEFYYMYYRDSHLEEDVVVELLEHVAQELSVPVAKLRPSDRFDLELKAIKGWEFDSGNTILLREISRRAQRAGKSLDLTQIVTLDDYIQIMSSFYDEKP